MANDVSVRVTRDVALPPEAMWLVLSDVPTTAAALPNCTAVSAREDGRERRFDVAEGENPIRTLLAADDAEREERTVAEGETFVAHLAIGIGGLDVEFDAEADVLDRDYPTIRARGTGDDGANAFEVDAVVEVLEAPRTDAGDDRCAVRWTATLSASGPAGALGARVLEPAVERAVDDYFDSVERYVAAARDYPT
ncbi:CoxG family protein [Haloferacaceae archaeon DSL9]